MDEKAGAEADIAHGASPLLSAEGLIARLGDPGLRVIDARFELTDAAVGPSLYTAGHVPGAVYLDLDADLASPPGPRGRHPLPDLAGLARRLGAIGVGSRHDVVVYDQVGSMYAARAWWLLRYMGHERVRVLDGGFSAYLAAGGPVTTEVPSHPSSVFELEPRTDMVLDLDQLRARLDDPGLVILDARAPERYRGENEPLDPKAGHIPGALNMPYAASVGPDGMPSPGELQRLYRLGRLPATGDVVAYCGSGVSAAHLVLALEVAGKKGVKLYPGSWSEWSRRDDMPVAVGDEEARE